MTRMRGVYLPLVTPFHDGDVDLESVTTLVRHYAATGIDGIILLATTGESPTVERAEQGAVVAAALEVAGDLPVFVGVSGNSTKHVAATVRAWEAAPLAGYLVVTPYYNRPGADGLVEHFRAVAGETERTVIVYNVPYRTGVNLPNDALLEIAATVPNVRAVKDSTGNIVQSLDLLQRAPEDLSVLTGEDHLYFTSLVNGGAGGILAAAHLATPTFVEVAEAVGKQELVRAREAWRTIAPMIPTLFAESNPMPLKYCLWKLGLLRSPECRLPLTEVSPGMARALDAVVAGLPEG
jgi:4-hydroxy-tetrahydrodipicolinate synthase